MKGFLTNEQIDILREAHYSCRLRKSADRIKAILFLNEGFDYEQTAKLLMLDDVTIRRYEKQFEKIGVDGLIECKYFGSKGFLTKQQGIGLTTHLKNHTYQTVKAICLYAQKHYRKSYSVEGMTHLLHRLGFVYKKTKRIPGKLNPQKQAEFIKVYQELKAQKKKQDRIYFLDATHPQHNSYPSYGWIYKGQTKTIKANTGRKRLNLNGALNLEDLTITVLEEKTINTNAVVNLCLTLEEQQPKGILYLIMDNARHNRSKNLQYFLNKHKRIKPIYLPTYSPNLNIIERLWLFFHKKILYNRYYQTFPEFKNKTLRFFQTIDKYKPELQTLLTDSFQTISM
jgi:transposase